MWELIKTFFLGATTLLTPAPISVGLEPVELVPSKHLIALDSGASIRIRMSRSAAHTSTMTEEFRRADLTYPHGCVHAQVIAADGTEVAISNVSFGVSNSETFLQLSAKDGIPTDKEFVKVRLHSSCQLTNVLVSWQNYEK